MKDSIINAITIAILGGGFGSFFVWISIRYKMLKDKRDILKKIKTQDQQEFMIPKIINGKTVQKTVNLKEYCDIK